MIDTSPNSWRWDQGREEIQFFAWQNGALVMCRISREAIEMRYNSPSTLTACMCVAQKYSDDIAAMLDRLLVRGRFEDDGSVLLRSSDWPS